MTPTLPIGHVCQVRHSAGSVFFNGINLSVLSDLIFIRTWHRGFLWENDYNYLETLNIEYRITPQA